MSFNIHQNHPLIQREQTFFLDRKLITIHSEDRDINKWPTSNEFEVLLPQDMINIYSMRLINIDLPSNYYTFTNSYQNTKFIFEVNPDISGSSGIEYNALFTIFQSTPPNNFYTLEITEGFYCPEDLALELQCKLNDVVTQTLLNGGFGLPSTYMYDHFVVRYDKVQHKFVFLNDRDQFYFNFDIQVGYGNIPCNQKIVWDQHVNWGLPHNLGFKKESYQSVGTPNYKICYDSFELIPDVSSGTQQVWSIKSPSIVDIYSPNVIYMELDKYNSIDEIDPYSGNTSGMYNNDYHGRTNSAFARIPVIQNPFSQLFDSRNGFLNNLVVFKTPLTKLRKMRFKFRYHDGRLVDFKNMSLSFCIEVNQLIDEQERRMLIHVPATYTL
jgi:hypothetical protein